MVVQVILANAEDHPDPGTAIQILQLKAGQFQNYQVRAPQLIQKADRRHPDIAAGKNPLGRPLAQDLGY